MSHIHSRSPYFVQDTVSGMVSATLELYIYTGQQTVARPSTATYTLFSTAINEEVIFEIGQLINDKVQFINDNSYRTDGVWVDYQVTRTLDDGSTSVQSMVEKYAIDGYTYYTEGANSTVDTAYLLSVQAIRCLAGEDYKVGINKNYDEGGLTITDVRVRRGTGDIGVYTVSSSDLSGQVIHYYNIPYHANNSSLRVKLSNGAILDAPITYESECKYDPKKLTFINKNGMMEDLWFFKLSKNNLNTERQDYQNNNIISGGTYNVQAGQNKVFNITSKESITLNTGYINEIFNETFTQLMQSESIWITENSQLIPVILKTESFDYKTSLNDQMINYTIDVEYAFNKMNTVR